jgi:dihydropteroate synthase
MDKGTFFYKKTTLNCKGKILYFQYPIVMGILNITPDSFYDGGMYESEPDIIKRVGKMLAEGASIIDIGSMSTKPGAQIISEHEELNRLIPVIKSIIVHFPDIIISVDTFRSNVARVAIKEGAAIINDISGGDMDVKMFETIARLNVPYVLMHMQGTPQTMQKNPEYKDVVKDIIYILSEKVEKLKQLGVNDIIIDPGFGFGKTVEHNYQLLKNLKCFDFFELPILVGISRKSMINKVLHIKPEDALNATSILNTIALLNGANILRVHDVKEAVETIKLLEVYNQSDN